MSKTKFYPCLVSHKIVETPSAISLILDPGDQNHLFSFRPGEYITLSANIDGIEVRRAYSISSSDAAILRVGIKKVSGGLFSNYAHDQLKEGDIIKVMPPQGNFLLKEASPSSTFVFFSAGSGITPIMSMIHHLLAKTGHRVLLFYGNKKVEDIMYREEIEDLKNEYMDRFSVYHLLSKEKVGSPIFHGRIDKQKCKVYHDHLIQSGAVSQYLLCGPEQMIFSVKECLEELGVPSEKISFELFTTSEGVSPSRSDKMKHDVSNMDSDHSSVVHIRLDGITSELLIHRDGPSILDAASEAGLDVPYSCKGGVCSTCKAKVLNGSVSMDTNYALEPEEVECGYILSCQSHPITSEVFIDYDQA